MDFHSVMETFAEAWVAANTHTPLTEAAEQVLINNPPSTQNPSQVQDQPPLIVLQESSKPEPESIVLKEINNRTSDHHSPGPTDLVLSESRPNRVQEIHGKSLPVHCIIEQIPGPQACGQYVELDSYAIVPSDTLFSNLVRTALEKLGYSLQQIIGAKGSIQVKKWKPLAFDQITENPEATVGDILSELTTMASLHVRLYSVPDSPQEWKDITVRNAVLELLREMSQIKLAKLCPLSQPMLSNIINNRYQGKIGKEKCQEFGQWYLEYRKTHPEESTPEVVPSDRPVDGRLTFHPTKELPLMRDWFQTCRTPSLRTLQMYVDVLNQGPVRQQERPKVVLSTLKNWWKNEKQRERKSLRSEDECPDSNVPKRRKKGEKNGTQKDTAENVAYGFNGSSSQDPPTKNNKFTLINHSENENELERYNGNKDGDVTENTTFSEPDHHYPISSPDNTKSNSKFSLIDHCNSPDNAKSNCKFSLIDHCNSPDNTKSNCKFSLLEHCNSPDNTKSNCKFSLIEHCNNHDKPIRNDGDISQKLGDGTNGMVDGTNGMVDGTNGMVSFKGDLPSESPFFQRHNLFMDSSLLSFTDHHLHLQNHSKLFLERTNIMEGGHSHISSEDDVDVGI